jgi:hypothetical protein
MCVAGDQAHGEWFGYKLGARRRVLRESRDANDVERREDPI